MTITKGVLKQIKEIINISWYEFAKRIGCTYTTIHNWQKGLSEISASYQKLINQTFHKEIEIIEKIRENKSVSVEGADN